MTLLHRIRRGLIFLAVVALVSIAGHKYLTGETWIDSLYFFVITVSTVGYGEHSSEAWPVQLFTIGVITVGTITMAYLLGLIVQSMIEGQINFALGNRRMTREIAHLNGHTIICGLGRIGQTLADELQLRGKDYVVIDRNPDVVQAACEDNQLVVTGDATLEETLLDAGIERASTVVVALKDDADNVFLTLTARNLNPNLKIIARGEQPTTEKKLVQAGADQVVMPALIGARRMAALVTRPHAAQMMDHVADHTKLEAELDELSLAAQSLLIGQSIREVAARQKHNLLVIAIRRCDGQMLFNPDPDAQFEAGDTLIVMGNREDIAKFQREFRL